MRNNLLLSALFLSLMACSQNSNRTVNSIAPEVSPSILGGQEVASGSREIVSTVALYNPIAKTLCTGTLIDQDIVLTAAHCITDKPEQMMVIFKNKINEAKADDFRRVVMAKKHEKYNPDQQANTADIAIVKFDIKNGLPASYGVAKMLPDFSLLKPAASIVAVGYGLNWSWIVNTGAGTLRKTQLKIHEAFFSETEIAVDQSLQNGVCSGDSGGPGYMDINGQLYLWGVVSRGDSLAIPLTPKCFLFSVYTRIDVYAKWVGDAILELNH